MYVIYHSSDSFASVTGVSLLSLFENNKHMDSIQVLYIERGMTEENKSRLRSVAEQYGRSIEFMTMPNWSKKLDIQLKSCKTGWLGFGYNRLFLTEFVPEDVERVLYLDSDTLVEGPLDELWNTNLDGYYMAGVDDCLSSTYRKLVDLKEGTYCNAGVLLMNLKKWREDNVLSVFMDVLKANNGYFVFNEQSILNSVFAGKVKVLHQKFNVNSLVYLFEYNELMKLRKPKNFSYSPEEYYEARNHPVLTHYTGNFYVHRRPWVEDSDHPHKDAFLRYRAMTPWAEEPLAPDTRDDGDKRHTELCHKLPRGMMIRSVSFLYNRLRPASFKRKIKKERK